MAGLLGDTDWTDPANQGLLQFGLSLLAGSGPSTKRTSVGQLIGLAGGQGMDAFNVARRQKLLDQESRRRDELAQAQLQEILAQAEEKKAKLAEQQRLQQVLSNALSPVSQVEALAAGGGPTNAAADMVGQRKPINYQMLLAQGIPPTIVEALAKSQDYGKPKVARTIEVDDGQGGKATVMVDEFGRPVGDRMPGYVAPVQVNQGDRVTFTRPVAGTTLPVGMSPDQRDASARGWANVNLSRERLALDKGAEGKAPPGYRFKPDGSLEAIPGGPADIKAGALAEKDQARKDSATSSAQNVLQTIDEARKLVGVTTTGAGGLMTYLPMTGARTLEGKLNTIKANLSFDRLQQMRNESPTGGALGQVAIQELEMLKATVASLDQLQKPSDLQAALDKIEQHYSNWLRTVNGNRGGAGGDWGQPAGSGFKFLGKE